MKKPEPGFAQAEVYEEPVQTAEGLVSAELKQRKRSEHQRTKGAPKVVDAGCTEGGLR